MTALAAGDAARRSSTLRVGVDVHDTVLPATVEERRALLGRIGDGDLDFVCVADHVSFQGGGGFDGMIAAAAVLAGHPRLDVLLGIYQAALRHPLPTARALSSLAEHETYYEAAQAICYKALWARQEGLPHTALASMSKWWPPLVAKDAIEGAMRIHGNLGYSAEFPHQQRFRDVMAYLVADGTSEIQKRIIAADLLKRVGA